MTGFLSSSDGPTTFKVPASVSPGCMSMRRKVPLKLGSLKRALRAFVQGGGAKDLNWGEVATRFGIGVPARPQWERLCDQHNDLLVYLGLANLRKKVPFGHLSPRLRLDVREFFDNYQRALQDGLELLYAAGDPGEIDLACEELKLGWQDEQALYVQAFDHRGSGQLLYFKERFLAPDHPGIEEMTTFSAKLRKVSA